MAPSKVELRSSLLAARAARSPDELGTARAAIADRVVALGAQLGWRSVAAYRPLRTEPGSVELIQRLRAAGIRVITPVLLPDRDLDWTTEPDRGELLGLDAVRDVDAVLVPALAVDRSGTRLGRGGGSYDRVLARLGAAVATYALLFDGEVHDELPADSWDRRVRAAITPSRVVRLGRLDAE